MKELSLVIPVFNEESIIVHSIETIIGELNSIDQLQSFELLIVDDGSSDATWDLLINDLCPRFEQIHAIKLSRNFGKESALCAGLEIADAQAIVIIDADLQHPPALIAQMLEIWRGGSVDIVEAIKRSRGDEPFVSRLAANGFYALFSRLSGVNLKNASDFKLMDKRVVDAWRELPERNLFFRGMSAWVGFDRQQIEFDVAERADSESKWSTIDLLRLAFTSIAAYSSAPLHLITGAGVVFIIFSLFLGLWTLFQHWSGVAVSGFATVILLLLIIGGTIMVSLGIIGEYLARIYDEVKARPRFLIAADSKKPKSRQAGE
ncbi:MAG: glycosyltransferase involved in cell wall biosynthesis [Halioglobus sp.]|jgi:glycosyltransferase involved in cell wall biosynthesis